MQTMACSETSTDVNPPGPRGLAGQEFACIARNGFGDPGNAYCHAMGWFRDRLYVGTTRHTLFGCSPYDRGCEMDIWPVQVPDVPWEVDWRGQIWRFDPETCRFENVFVSPMTPGSRGFDVPVNVGFRDMAVYQGRSDPEPALYITSWGSHMGAGPSLVRSFDGVEFEHIGLDAIAKFANKTLRPLTTFRDRLFTANAGQVGKTDADQRGGMILVSRDPGRGEWELASEPYFGDPKNLAVFDLTEFNGHLYAGTFNPYDGFHIWKTDAEGEPPYKWKKVIGDGAGRGRLNEGAITLCEFRGALYAGTGIYNCGFDRIYNIGPAAPELIRIHPDDSWDLIVGEPRCTAHGLKSPTSGLLSGFGNPFAGYLWRLCNHNGAIYAGTAVWSTWLPFTRRERWPTEMQELFTLKRQDELLEKYGGFDLWQSQDGDRWQPVTVNGFDNRFNMGARTMVSSPSGLFVGTVNQFGPKVARRRVAGWRYEPNSDGGAEVWWGHHKPLDRDVKLVPLEEPPRWRLPASELIQADATGRDALAEFYSHSAWRHVGYWLSGTKNAVQACENLMEELIAFTRPDEGLKAPDHPSEDRLQAWQRNRPNPKESPQVVAPAPVEEDVLVIGSGLSAMVQHLLKYYKPGGIMGVSASRREISRCRRQLPWIAFCRSKLHRLRVGTRRFDKVFSIEGPSLCRSRQSLLAAVYRVLKPGGQVVFSDMVLESVKHTEASNESEYQRLLQGLGYTEVQVTDATENCARAFASQFSAYLRMKSFEGAFSPDAIEKARRSSPAKGVPITSYWLISARRPPIDSESVR